jgi:hypothetical protein
LTGDVTLGRYLRDWSLTNKLSDPQYDLEANVRIKTEVLQGPKAVLASLLPANRAREAITATMNAHQLQ